MDEKSNSSEPTKIDTNLTENRQKRAKNQFEFEQTKLPETFGQKFKDRFLMIRDGLFAGFSDVDGEDVHRLAKQGKVMSDKRGQTPDEYMPTDAAAEEVLPKYMGMVDSWYQEINRMPYSEDREQAVKRMLSTMFVCGIMIHPVRDGNGQSFKMTALSYLHDLLPQYRDKFFPIKYDVKTHMYEHEVGIKFMGGGVMASSEDLSAGRVPEIVPKDEIDAKLVDLLKRTYDIRWKNEYDDSEPYDTRKKRLDKQVENEITKVTSEVNLPQLAERDVSRWETTGRFWSRKKVPIYPPPLDTFQKKLYDHLIKEGYDEERVTSTVYGSVQKIGRASYAIRQLIGSEDGSEVLTNYVLRGKDEIHDGDTIPNVLYNKALRQIKRQQQHMFEIIETGHEHEQRHKRMIS